MEPGGGVGHNFSHSFDGLYLKESLQEILTEISAKAGISTTDSGIPAAIPSGTAHQKNERSCGLPPPVVPNILSFFCFQKVLSKTLKLMKACGGTPPHASYISDRNICLMGMGSTNYAWIKFHSRSSVVNCFETILIYFEILWLFAFDAVLGTALILRTYATFLVLFLCQNPLDKICKIQNPGSENQNSKSKSKFQNIRNSITQNQKNQKFQNSKIKKSEIKKSKIQIQNHGVFLCVYLCLLAPSKLH